MNKHFYPLTVAAVLLTFLGGLNCSRVAGPLARWTVSDSEEVALGTNLYNQILADTSYSILDTNTSATNKAIWNYVDSIGNQIADNQTGRPENAYLTYKFTVIDNDTTINAFAIPGGYVFIYTGLLHAARNEAEIAGVLAHEIAHITQRHGIEKLVEMQGISFVRKLIFGDDESLLLDIATSLLFLRYSRDNEDEADSCAVEYLIEGFYNPNGMKTFLESLADSSGWSFEPLSTHPDPKNRVELVKALIATKPSSVTSIVLPPKLYP